jgi:drug/metabolite transporter (DMT)-like permease
MFQPRAQNNGLAALFIVSAGAFIAASTLFAKALGQGATGPALHPLQISHGRFVFAFAVLALAAGLLRPRFGRVHWPLHVARTSCGWAGVTLMFAAVAFIPLSDATAISFLNPVFAMLLAIPLLGEKVGPIRWFAAGMALLGALVLLRPTPDSFQPAALLALGAAMVMGVELIGLGIASIAVLAVWQPPTAAQWGLLAGVGVSMALAQTCFVNGMARADASFVAPFSYATLLFAALYDLVFFDVLPDAISLLGTAIIVAGAVTLALREARIRRRR